MLRARVLTYRQSDGMMGIAVATNVNPEGETISWSDVAATENPAPIVLAEGIYESRVSAFDGLTEATYPGIPDPTACRDCLLAYEVTDAEGNVTYSRFEQEIGEVSRGKIAAFIETYWGAKRQDFLDTTDATDTWNAVIDAIATIIRSVDA